MPQIGTNSVNWIKSGEGRKSTAYETASNQRKELIASTLKELLQTKPLSKISVTELVQQCRINRKTFYYHFEDIYALLKWMLEREIIEMLRQYDLLSDYDAALGFALDYIGENYTMLRNIYNSMEVEHLRRFFFSCFREITRLIIEEPAAKMGYRVTEEYKAFLIDFYTEGIVGGMIHEISNPSFYKRETLSAYIYTTFRGGILQSLKDAQENGL